MSDDGTGAQPTSSTWHKRAFAVFKIPDYRIYYSGLLCSVCGFWIRIAATGWLVYELTGSKEKLGLITAASLLPWVVVSPIAGVIADRANLRTVLFWTYLAIAAVNAVLGWGLLAGWVGIYELVALSVLLGCVRGIENPMRHALVRRIVNIELLPSAIGMNAAAFHLMNACGFAVGGLVYHYWGAPATFFVIAGVTVPMAFQLLQLPRDVGEPVGTSRDVLGELREGFRYVRTHVLTRWIMTGAALLILVLLSFRTIMPAVAKDRLLLDSLGYGKLMAMSGVGSLVAALWIASRDDGLEQRVTRMVKLGVVTAVSLAVIGYTSSVWIAGIAIMVAGFCQVGFMATANTTVQQTVPDELRGRVMGIWALMFGAAFPIGSYLISWIAELWGTERALFVSAATGLLLSAAFIALKRRARRRGAQAPPAQPVESDVFE